MADWKTTLSENATSSWSLFLLLLIGAVFLYIPSFGNVWLMDDFPVIVNNPDIRSFGNFLENFYQGRPLRELTYLLDYHFFGLEPFGYHFQQIFWHGLNSFLVFSLARLLGANLFVAISSAVFFLTHPVQVEVVANISHRKDSLSLAFCLSSLCVYLHGRGKPGFWWHFLLSLLLAWIGYTAKQNAVVLPLVIVLYELSRCNVKYHTRRFLIGWSVCLLLLLWRVISLSSDSDFIMKSNLALAKMGNFQDWTLAAYWRTVLKGWSWMLSRLVWPFDLSMEYVFKVPLTWWDLWVVAALLLAIFFIFMLWISTPGGGVPALALIWIGAFWLPTSNLLGSFSYFAADRYLYAPMAGFSLLLAWFLQRIISAKLIATALVTFLLIGLSALTINQQKYWKESLTFHQHMLEVSPDSLEGMIGLADDYIQTGEFEKSINYLKRAMSIYGQEARIFERLGRLSFMMGHYDDAVTYYQRAKILDEGNVDIYNNLAVLYNKIGERGAALAELSRAVALNPRYEVSYLNMGVVYEDEGQMNKAEEMYRKAIAEKPDYTEAHYNLGVVLYRAGSKEGALKEFLKAASLRPDYEDAIYNIGIVANEVGDRQRAGGALEKLKALRSGLVESLERELMD